MRRPIIWSVLFGSALVSVLAVLATVKDARAHSGSPSFVTFTPGTTLTATDLNNALAHIHNTLSGGIANVHISTTAAIAHSKLATPALVPKAWALAREGSACDGVATGDCTISLSSGVNRIWGTGTAGRYNVDLTYVPVNVTKYVVIANALDTGIYCYADGLGTLGTPIDFQLNCKQIADGTTATNTRFSLLVLDSP